MLTTREAALSIFGAYRLARFDPTGMQYLESTPEGALRSFYAALIVLPGYIFLVLISQWDLLQQVSLLSFTLVEGIGYVVRWTAYALVMFHVARYLDRGDRYPAFLCAYNWSAVIQVTLLVLAFVLSLGKLVPDGVGEGLVVIASVGVLIYQWFITRTALQVGGFMAFALVVLDLVLTEFITGLTEAMLLGG